MQVNLFQSGSFTVDSGQYTITKLNIPLIRDEYVDKRKFVYLPTGEVINKYYLWNWSENIPAYGMSLNEINEKGLLDKQHEPLCNALSYQGACDTTLYCKDGIGFIGQNEAVATSTQYGDGTFAVYTLNDDAGCIINTGFDDLPSVLELDDLYFRELSEPFIIGLNEGGVTISDACCFDKLNLTLPAGTYRVRYGWPTEEHAQEERHHYVMLLRDGEGTPMQISPNMLVDVAPDFGSTMGYLLTSAWKVHQQDLEPYRASKVKDAGGEVNLMAQLTHSCSRVSGWINEVIDFEELCCVFDYDYAEPHEAGSLAEAIYLETLKQSSDLDVCQVFLNWCNNNQIQLKPAVDLMI